MASSAIVRYLSHPQVRMEPERAVDLWSLDEVGRSRVAALCHAIRRGGALLDQTTLVISSAETGALETAKPLAKALGAILMRSPGMRENDRSATGYLPAAASEALADAFFANPDRSQRGSETAPNAQTRILEETPCGVDGHCCGRCGARWRAAL